MVGSILGGRIAEDVLRKAFGWFVVMVAVFVLAQQLPGAVRTNQRSTTRSGVHSTSASGPGTDNQRQALKEIGLSCLIGAGD